MYFLMNKIGIISCVVYLKNIEFIDNIQLCKVNLYSVAADSVHTHSKNDLHCANYGTP